MTNYSTLKDKTLVSRARRNGDTFATEELINRHERIIFTVINKFCNRNPNINREDMMDDRYSIMNYAITTYKRNKAAKFSSWLYLNTRFWILNHNKHADRTITHENSDIDKINNSNQKFYTNEDALKYDKKYFFNLLGQIKDKRIIDIFKMRYFDENGKKFNSWKDIAAKVNLSITRVISLHNYGKDILYKKINSKSKMDTL